VGFIVGALKGCMEVDAGVCERGLEEEVCEARCWWLTAERDGEVEVRVVGPLNDGGVPRLLEEVRPPKP